MGNLDNYKTATPDTEFAKMDILSRCEDLLSNITFDREYYSEYLSKYENTKHHLDAMDRATVKIEKIQDHYNSL